MTSLVSTVRLKHISKIGAARITDYFALIKPGITLVVLMTTFAGFFVGLRYSGNVFSGMLLIHTLLGTAFVSAGAGALNMLLEADVDALMQRTKIRPLPMQRLRREEAFLYGTLMASFGVDH